MIHYKFIDKIFSIYLRRFAERQSYLGLITLKQINKIKKILKCTSIFINDGTCSKGHAFYTFDNLIINFKVIYIGGNNRIVFSCICQNDAGNNECDKFLKEMIFIKI